MSEKPEHPPTQPTVEEVVAGLDSICHRFEPGHGALWNSEHLAINRAIKILQSLTKDAGRWVPWKPGDALPPVGHYWCADKSGHHSRWVCSGYSADWEDIDVVAYWPIPMPPPYTAIDLARGATGENNGR